MAQRRFFIYVRHPLASAASSAPPQFPLGDETTRNTKTLEQPAPRKNTHWRARHHRHHPSFPWGTKPRGTQKPRINQIQGKHLLTSAASLTPTHIPLGDETSRNTKTLGQPAPRNNTRWRAQHHRRLPSFPWGTKPRGTQKLWGNHIQGKKKRWRVRHHQRLPSFTWGTKPRGTMKSAETTKKKIFH